MSTSTARPCTGPRSSCRCCSRSPRPRACPPPTGRPPISSRGRSSRSWIADGAGNSANGNNQESTSEALDFAAGLIQWGQATGDANITDLGLYLYNTEINAFFDYYFNQNPSLGGYAPGFSTTQNPRGFIT